jgi:hypothetical protein
MYALRNDLYWFEKKNNSREKLYIKNKGERQI